MAELDADFILSQVSEEEPCGPDLDQENDLDFTGFIPAAEGELPRSFFEFQRNSAELARKLEIIAALSARTRDLRLLVLAAKFHILDRDAANFSNVLNIIARLLEERWPDVHPRADEGRFDLRMATLANLDDMAQVVIPLQHVMLVETRASGPISFRAIQIAAGKLTARASEQVLEQGVVERAFEAAGLDRLRARRGQFAALLQAVKRIEVASLEGEGAGGSVRLPRLKALAGDIVAVLDAHVGSPEPEQGAEPSEGDGVADTVAAPHDTAGPTLAGRREAGAALMAAERYFEHHEPSSPALMLVRFARQLMGQSFFSMLRMIVPDHAGDAEIRFGGHGLRLPVARLAEPFEQEAEPGDREDMGAEMDMPDNRRAALRLLSEVSKYLRSTEPSNPVPQLLDRAAELSTRDFTALMKDIFTAGALKAMQGESD